MWRKNTWLLKSRWDTTFDRSNCSTGGAEYDVNVVSERVTTVDRREDSPYVTEAVIGSWLLVAVALSLFLCRPGLREQ